MKQAEPLYNQRIGIREDNFISGALRMVQRQTVDAGEAV